MVVVGRVGTPTSARVQGREKNARRGRHRGRLRGVAALAFGASAARGSHGADTDDVAIPQQACGFPQREEDAVQVQEQVACRDKKTHTRQAGTEQAPQ